LLFKVHRIFSRLFLIKIVHVNVHKEIRE